MGGGIADRDSLRALDFQIDASQWLSQPDSLLGGAPTAVQRLRDPQQAEWVSGPRVAQWECTGCANPFSIRLGAAYVLM